MSRSGKKSVRFEKDDISADGSESFDLDDNGMDVDNDDDGGEDDDGGHIMLSDMLGDDEDVVTDADHDALLRRLGKASTSAANNKKRKLADLYQTRNEGSFELRGRVGVDDLLGSLDKASESRKKLAKLMRTQDNLKIAESLSRPAQERVDREVQYKDTKTRLDGWLPTVQSMRKAPNLVFPLPESDPTAAKPSNRALFTKFTPETDLERQIQGVLEASGISEQKLAEYEALKQRELTPEEIRERHAQLSKMRSLFFFQEQKNKRLKKIKSKKYRKILRHSKERNQPTLEELEELDPEAAKEERLKLEKARAEERMTRKHKTTGKWAKYAAKSKDVRFKDALNDHLRRGQDLMRKMNSMNAGSDDDSDDMDDDDSDSDDDSEDIEAEEQSIRASLQQEKRQKKSGATSVVGGHVVDEDGVLIDAGVAVVSRPNSHSENLAVPLVDQDSAYPTSGVLGMRFMKRAADKKRSEFNKLLEDMNEEDKDWQNKMEAALRENQIRHASNDEDDDMGGDSDAGSDDESTQRRQEKQAEKARKQRLDEQKETERLKKQHVVQVEGGRQKFGLIGAGTSASTRGSKVALSADEQRSMRKLSSNAHSLEPGREGFEIGLSGPLEIAMKGSSSRKEHVPMDLDSDDDAEDGATFNVNKTDVAARLKSMEKSEAAAAAKKKNNSTGKAQTQVKAAARPQQTAEDSDSDDDEETGHISFSSKPQKQQQQKKKQQTAAVENPWLGANDDDEAPIGVAPTGKTSEQKKQLKKQEDLKKAERAKQRKTGDSSAPLRLDLEKIREDLQRQNEDDEPAFNLTTASSSSRAQRELINRAFAADHITEDQLEAEKNAEAAENNEVEAQMADMLMPGWGDWAGPQVQPSKRRQRLLATMEEKKAARQAELLGNRKDSKIKHVVINEKRVKKFAKYEAGAVPYPYKTREEYEASLRTPLGKEWNTTLTHKAVIAPKVKVKRGKIIEPIKNKQQ